MSRKRVFIGTAAIFCLAAVSGFAQAPQGRGGGGRGGGGGGDNTVMAARQLKPGLCLLTGAGANTLVRVTPEGFPLSRRIAAAFDPRSASAKETGLAPRYSRAL